MATLVNTREIVLGSTSPRSTENTVVLASTNGNFILQKNTATASPASIVLTATASNYTTPTYSWHYAVNSAPNTWVSVGSNQNNLTVSNTNFVSWVGAGASVQFRVTVTENLKFTTVAYYTVNYVKEGNDGTSGVNAILPDLISESDVLTAEPDGSGYTLTSLPSNALRLYSGGTLISNGVSYNVSTSVVNGLTATINASSGAISITGSGWNTDNANFTFNAITSGATYSAAYSIAKSRKGVSGTSGSNAVLADLISESDVISANTDGTGYSLASLPANALRLYSGGSQLTSGVTYTVSTSVVSGLTATINSSGAITLSGTNWTSDTAGFTFNAITSGATYSSAYSIAKSKTGIKGDQGIPGANAVIVDLLSDSDVLAAESNGTGYTLTSLPSNALRLYSGGALITTGVSYSVSTSVVSGLTATINASGVISLSGAGWNSDTASFTFNGITSGVTYSAVYSIAKSRKGIDGSGSNAVLADLLSESDVISANANGTGYTLASLPSNALRLYNGGSQVLAGVTYTVSTSVVSGLTATIDASGVISLSGTNWTSDTAGFTFNAITSGSTYSAAYSIAKSKSGASGTSGSSAVYAYRVITSTSLPGNPSISVNDAPTAGTAVSAAAGGTLNWYALPKSTLAANEWQFEVSGTKTVGNVYTWNPTEGYLSTFKVGQLSALGANTGSLTVDNTLTLGSNGKIQTTGGGYTSTGVFLGDATGAGSYRFSVGNTSQNKMLAYDGTNLVLTGDIVGNANIVNNAVTTSKIDTTAVTTPKIADLAITAIKIDTTSITTPKIADLAITVNKIDTTAVTTQKIADLAITEIKIDATAISTPKIANLAITAPKIDTTAVTTTKIADLAITEVKIDNTAISTPKIANLAITEVKIGTTAITTPKIADLAITVDKIGTTAITTPKIADLAITELKIGTTAITTPKIANLAITEVKIGTTAITTPKIADLAITEVKIGTTAITTPKIADLAITEVKIGTTAITTPKIADLAISTPKIADLAISAPKIDTTAVTTTKIADLAITTPKIDNTAISTVKIADLAISTVKLVDSAVITSKLLIPSTAGTISPDPNTEDLSAWTGGTLAIVADSTSPTGRALQVTSSGLTTLQSDFTPIDTQKSYNLSTWVKRVSGTATCYLTVVFYTSNFLPIDGNTNPNGWPAVGSYHYWGIWAAQPDTNWREYRISFGLSEAAAIPSTAKYLQLGFLANYADGPGEQRFTGIRLLQKADKDLIVSGSITTDKIAANAVTAGSIATNAITSDKIAANAVTAGSIAANAITSNKIVAGAVTAGSIASNAITSDKIAANSVTAGSIASNAITSDKIVAGAVTAGSIAANAVTAGSIAANAITSDKIAANAVTANSIAANAITADKIAANTITAGSIASNAITSDKIAANAVTAGSIAANAVTAGSIAANAITSDKIAANAVTAGSIAANAVTAGSIAANAITSDKINANAVTAGSIAANAVTTSKISAGAITAGSIAANAVTAGSIAANAITADKIAANAVTAGSIAANAITSDKINANAVTAGSIAANAVTTNKIATGAITAGSIAANAVTAGSIASNAISTNKLLVTANANCINDDPMFQDPSAWDLGVGVTYNSGTGASGAVGNTYIGVSTGTDLHNYSSKFYPIGPGKRYRLSANLYAASGNTRNIYLFLQFYDQNGTYIPDQGWGGTMSGYTYGGAPPTEIFTRQGGQFGSGTDRIIPAGARSCKIGVWFQYSGGPGSSQVFQACQDLRLEELIEGELIVSGAITADKIAANAVTAGSIAANAITSNKIAANAVTAGSIASNAITSDKIVAGAVTAGSIASNAITSDKIAANSITAGSIAANAITSDKIAANAVTAGSIAANAVTAGSIAANAITSDKINANAVTAGSIAANAVTTSKISAGAITAGSIAANAVTAGSIASNAITSDKIAANAVTANSIAANAITADKIAANTITAGSIAANAITSNKIAANAVTAGSIATNAITSDKIQANAIVASKIVVTNQDSVFPDPGWYDRTWWTGGSTVSSNIFASESSTWPVRRVLQFNGNIGTFDFSTASIPIELGATYRYKVTIYMSSTFAGSWGVHAHFPDQAWFEMGIPRSGTLPSTLSAVNIPVNDWRTYTSTFTNAATLLNTANPNNVTQFRFSGNQTAGDVYIAIDMVRAAGADLIVDGAVTAVKVAANAITADKIAANAVTAGSIASNAITSDKIAANAVTANSIASSAITSDKIQANAVTAGSIASNAITSDKIAANAVTAGSIAANAVTAGSIAANAITSDKINANAVTAGSIAANAVTTNKIAVGAITAGSIAANAVTAGSIASNAITSDKIAANAVTANSIASGAVTASKINITNGNTQGRVTVDNNKIIVWSDTNVQRVKIGYLL